MTTFGAKLKKLRTGQNMGRTVLAERLDLSENTIHYLEADLRNPSIETVKKVCREFNVTANWLLGIQTKKSKAKEFQFSHDELVDFVADVSIWSDEMPPRGVGYKEWTEQFIEKELKK